MEELYDKIIEDSDDEIIGLYDLESHRREVERSAMEEAVREGIEQTARNMLKENISIEIISKVTGLSTEKIKEL